MKKYSALMVLVLIVSILAACAPVTTTVEVVKTVEVEKQVEVVTTVEVEKEVVTTQIVEVEVAPAPSDLEADLVMWTSPMTGSDEKPLYEELIKRFQVQYPNVNVQVEWVPWGDRDAKFSAAIAAGTTPDVAYVFVEGILGWVKDAVLYPLDEFISQENWDDILPLWQKAVTSDVSKGAGVDEHIWMTPYLANGLSHMYNKDLFTLAGLDPEKPPSTWDELLTTCEAVKALGEGYYCFPLLGKIGYNQWMAFWWQAGGNMFSDDFQTLRINDEAGLEAMTFLNTLNQNGYVPKESILNDWQGLDQIWLSGKLAIKDLWAASAPFVATDFQVGYLPSLLNKQAKTFAAYGGWGMFSNSDQKEAGGAWLDFLMAPENITFWLQWVAAHGTQFQGTTYTTAELITSNNALFSAIVADQAVTGEVHQLTPGYMTYTDVLGGEVETMLLENKDPKQALDDAAAKISELMAEE